MDFTPLVDKLALYFQIRDDLVNLASTDYMTSKSFCEDLTEGKFSFPIIHTIRSQPNDNQLLNVLKKHTDSIPIKQYAVEHMEKCGSFRYTQEKLQRLHAEVLQSIDAMGGHRELSALVQYLHRQVLQVKSPRKGSGGSEGEEAGVESLLGRGSGEREAQAAAAAAAAAAAVVALETTAVGAAAAAGEGGGGGSGSSGGSGGGGSGGGCGGGGGGGGGAGADAAVLHRESRLPLPLEGDAAGAEGQQALLAKPPPPAELTLTRVDSLS
jgi:hypothetical protein